MQQFEALKALIAAAEKDAEAFFSKNNQAAGTRLRNAMQQVKVKAQDIRTAVTEQKNAAK